LRDTGGKFEKPLAPLAPSPYASVLYSALEPPRGGLRVVNTPCGGKLTATRKERQLGKLLTG